MLKLPRNAVRGIIFSNYGFKWGFQYTTSATNVSSSISMADYLVNSLGFSKEKAIIISSKSKVSGFNSTENPNSVIEFLKTSGFDKSHIKKTVSCFPRILLCNVDKTLKPKLKFLQDLGLSGSDLADIVSTYPYFFRRRIDTYILPLLEALKSVFGENDCNPIMLRALKRSPWMLDPPFLKNFLANVTLLQNYRLPLYRIKALLLIQPRYFSTNPKWLQAILIKVEQKLGIRRDSSMFYHGICAVACMTEENLELKMEIYHTFGWTESDFLTLARRNPYALSCSEIKIRRCLNFFTKDLGFNSADLARYPCFVNYSLEKRVIPRNEALKVLKDNGLIKNNYCLLSCLPNTEVEFLKRFVLPFEDKVPGLYDDYMKRVSSSLEAAK